MKFLKISKTASQPVRALLYNNVIGTPGESMVYQHQKVAEKLNHITDPFFVTLNIRSNLLSTCCFCKRKVFVNGEPVTAFYIRYFTFKESFRSKARKKVYRRSDNQLKKEIDQLLKGGEFGVKQPHLYYAYIDPENVRSIRLVEELGFEPAGTFHTLFFSRFFPKRHKNVLQVTGPERDEIVPWMEKHYKGHQFFSDENIFYEDGFYVIKSSGDITAGIQATPEKWKIHELPGRNGRILLSVISKLPLLRRLFSREFNFLSVEGILCKAGHELELEKLLSDVLARHQIYTAVMCLDPQSREYKMIKSLKPGAMSKLTAEKRLQVMVRSEAIRKPVDGVTYVSAFDVM